MAVRLTSILSGSLPAAFLLATGGIALGAEALIVLVSEVLTAPDAHAAKVVWLFASGGGLGFLAYAVWQGWQRSARTRVVGDVPYSGQPAGPAQALVIVASPGGGADLAARSVRLHIEEFKTLRIIRVLRTDDVKGAACYKAIERGLLERFRGRTFGILPVDIRSEEMHNPVAVEHACERIYDDLSANGFAEADILLDYTGGPAAFTAGMVLAANCGRRRLQYLETRRGEDGHLEAESFVREVHLELGTR